MLADVPGHGVHQMRLAEPHAAIEKKRIERHRITRTCAGLGDAPGRGMGELVGLADDEILEDKAMIESQELRLVVADFERQDRSGGSRQSRRGFHVIIRAGEMIAIYRPRRHSHDDPEALYLLLLRPPQRAKPVRIMGPHPLAHKAPGCLPARLSPP